MLLTLVLITVFAEAGNERRKVKRVRGGRYLEKYEYLESGGKAERPRNYRNAIKRLQEEAGLTVTGKLDDRTKEVVSRPRCGNSDGSFEAEDIHFSQAVESNSRSRRAANSGRNRWDTHRLTFDIQNKPRNLSQQQVRRALRKALGIWSSVSGLDFNELGRHKHRSRGKRAVADLNIGFREKNHECGNTRAFDGPGGELAHAFFPTAGQAHFDTEEKWSLKDREGYNNLVVVATHEVGHMLGLGHSDVRGSIMNAWYNDPTERDQFSKARRHVKLNWDDIRAIQDLYDGPRSSKAHRQDLKKEHLRGDYTAAITLSATRVLLIQGNMAITRLPGGALTPKRPLAENFDHLDGKVVAAAYSSHLNLFYFFNERGILYIYSGSGSKGKHLTTTYQRVNLRTIPNAMFIQNERLWAICRGSVYYSALSTRPHFFFYQKVQLQFPSAPLKINGAFTDSRGGTFLLGVDNQVWRYSSNGTSFSLDQCYPKKITQSLLSC